ncbi:chemotaxis protein [Robbsia andropogonis]|uniref:Chemotaxis protein n=1 Tax=Robbsia andropogonis TaxID=28092 RepID=A0A0F5JVF3_9BURK|nr:methyl-accepting chemotaxis protein [Robbsia andropogonis]KKB61848.1 chemotaxis protein [Robbsia andropogonis]
MQQSKKGVTVRAGLLTVLVAFAAMILLGGAVGVVSLGGADRTNTTLAEVARQVVLANDGYKDSTRTRAALTRAYSALKERGDTATRDGALKSAQTTIDKAATETQALRDAPVVDGIDPSLARATADTSIALATLLESARDALRAGDTNAYVAINDAKITVAGQRYTANLENFQSQASAAMRAASESGAAQYHRVIGLVVIGIIFSLVLLLVTHITLRRWVIGPLQQASGLLDRIAANDLTATTTYRSNNEIGQLFDAMRRMQHGLAETVSVVRSRCEAINTGTREIAAGNLDLSARTEQQSASLGETASSMKELTSTVKRNADHAREANNLANSAASVAKRGGEVIGDVMRTMDDISASSRKIADITGLIDGIAFQTNILALNAAVEAARAGDQGKGFAVVASEVRSLAQRSASAAKEIKGLIESSVSDVSHGNRLVTQAGTTISEVVGSVDSLATLMAEISAATLEQSDGISQVEQAVSQMDQVTQQNAALVEEASAATSSLESQVEDMVSAVSAFRLR